MAKFKRKIKDLRKRDYYASQRADYFIANSDNTKKRIKKYYDKLIKKSGGIAIVPIENEVCRGCFFKSSHTNFYGN